MGLATTPMTPCAEPFTRPTAPFSSQPSRGCSTRPVSASVKPPAREARLISMPSPMLSALFSSPMGPPATVPRASFT
eukprot:1850844-Pyramimonas_sp.AAC.1